MPVFSVPNIKISGIASAVPANTVDNQDYDFSTDAERVLFLKTVGIRYRRIVNNDLTASDLCMKAANKLLESLACDVAEINLLIFISQTPDYLIPFTSGILQEKLGLSKDCMAFDINLGCSGYVYGLSIAASLLNNMNGGKALLLVGDCSSSCISEKDKSVTPLFSDAGSATLIEQSKGDELHFNLQTDGKEFDDIIIQDGGMKSPFKTDSLLYRELESGIERNSTQMSLDGLKIFNFALREIPQNANRLMTENNKSIEEIDAAFFHQANLLLNESVRKKLKITADKTHYSLHDYGNTSSASIPVTICHNNSLNPTKLHQTLLCGFGVGLSWGSCLANLSSAKILPIIEV
jgi:3-oxoacyl-[acyl-carrier-protein] synthase-3